MTRILTHRASSRAWPIAVLLLAMQLLAAPSVLLAQNDETSGPVADQTADENADESADDGAAAETPAEEATAPKQKEGINVLV
ncbi:MAG: hypothetical protein IIA67_01805, partial [Planctomycetes bacterium]|nr:hypothetical protein [Planctomycetota bacterium]